MLAMYGSSRRAGLYGRMAAGMNICLTFCLSLLATTFSLCISGFFLDSNAPAPAAASHLRASFLQHLFAHPTCLTGGTATHLPSLYL